MARATFHSSASLIADAEAYSLRSCTQRVIGYLLQHEAVGSNRAVR